MRALLLEVGAGGATSVAESIASLHEWRFLVWLCAGGLTEGARRDSRAARRLLQRRLRLLGSRPVGVAEAVGVPVGSPVHLAGTARILPPGRPGAHIWRSLETNAGGLRALEEEAHDFFLTDDTGQSVCVIAAGGQLINADQVLDGDRVSVVGYADRVPEPRAPAGAGYARGDLAPILRSGDMMPLVVRVLP
jgi:hypothetical protein